MDAETGSSSTRWILLFGTVWDLGNLARLQKKHEYDRNL
ncbi:uncharacterized protein CPUR_07785 [Claviceps purpurea 20.1]|uniref:Uncharacterized protein n=1 Tax=Claviceps purpurea (strain 20.1) TaxID=1111077 RepID=M1VY87_CLAP2|nr:uncharacterized protein CPUR_07785 [Claviceps purpurea 20.1]